MGKIGFALLGFCFGVWGFSENMSVYILCVKMMASVSVRALGCAR